MIIKKTFFLVCRKDLYETENEKEKGDLDLIFLCKVIYMCVRVCIMYIHIYVYHIP